MVAGQVLKNNLWCRAAIIQTVRSFFIEQGYLEVETPVRIPSIVPEAHIEPIQSADCFLQTSPEMCMKRLLAAGHPKLFQICKCFRAMERGNRHLPEFTMLEWYEMDVDYLKLMDDCQNLLRFLVSRWEEAIADGSLCNVTEPWERLTVAEAFAQYAPVSVNEALEKNMFDEVLVAHVEPNLGLDVPTFLYDYPSELGSLARLKPNDSRFAERFELYMDGIELANGFSELTNPNEQRHRFEKERDIIREKRRDPGPMPELFLEDLTHISAAAGIALGIDRLVMLFCGAERIDEVVSFVPEDL
jgi:lysyl-tRNA synthetase class 2